LVSRIGYLAKEGEVSRRRKKQEREIRRRKDKKKENKEKARILREIPSRIGRRYGSRVVLILRFQ